MRRDVLGNNGERPDRGKRKGVVRARVYLQAEFETVAPRIPSMGKQFCLVKILKNTWKNLKRFVNVVVPQSQLSLYFKISSKQ